MKITKASMEDIPALCGLLEILFSQEAEFKPDNKLQSEGLKQIIEYPERGQILIIKEKNSIIGMINLLFTISTALGGKVAFLEDMVVHPDFHGHGAGSKLLQAAIDFAQNGGYKRITLLTDESNKSAQNFYKRHGFIMSEMTPMRYTF
jgi:GNAT superfamily N-acetyltransferase